MIVVIPEDHLTAESRDEEFDMKSFLSFVFGVTLW
jgi:hypothetical protein